MLYASCGGLNIFSTFSFLQTLWPSRKRYTYLTSIRKLMHHSISIQVSNLMLSRTLNYRFLCSQRNKEQTTFFKPPLSQQIPRSYFWQPHQGQEQSRSTPRESDSFRGGTFDQKFEGGPPPPFDHPPPFADNMFHSPFAVLPMIFPPDDNRVPPSKSKETPQSASSEEESGNVPKDPFVERQRRQQQRNQNQQKNPNRHQSLTPSELKMLWNDKNNNSGSSGGSSQMHKSNQWNEDANVNRSSVHNSNSSSENDSFLQNHSVSC